MSKFSSGQEMSVSSENVCPGCKINRPMYGYGGRCEDCWAEQADRWAWRGMLPLSVRQARYQHQLEDVSNGEDMRVLPSSVYARQREDVRGMRRGDRE